MISGKSYAILLVSYIIAFVIVGISFFIITKIINPDELGLYSWGLWVSSIGVLLLENSIKNALLKLEYLSEVEENTPIIFSFQSKIIIGLLILSSLVLLGVYYLLNIYFYDTLWVLLFSSIYWISSLFITLPLSILEKKMDYNKVAIIDSTYQILDRALPILFLWKDNSVSMFLITAVISRIFRILSLNYFQRVDYTQIFKSIKYDIFRLSLIKDIMHLFIGTSSMLIRDNSYIYLIGVMFGKNWIGFYTFTYQMALVSSQAFIQISSRVITSVTSNLAKFEDKVTYVNLHIKILFYMLAPTILYTYFLFPMIDDVFFDNKWGMSFTLLPYILFRMFSSIYISPTGSFLLVQSKGDVYYKTMWLWTIIELISAFIFLFVFNEIGIAISQGITVWIGLYLIAKALNYPILETIKNTLFSSSFFILLIYLIAFSFIDIHNYKLLLSVLIPAFIIYYCIEFKNILNLIIQLVKFKIT